MNMQDKDMDALFRNKLEDLEFTPSASVWNNINAQLNAGQKRRMVPVWSIAASVALFIAAGLYFIPRNITGDDELPKQKVAQVIQSPVKHDAAKQTAERATVEATTASSVKVTTERKYIAESIPSKKTYAAKSEAVPAETGPLNQTQEQVVTLAATSGSENNAIVAVVPDVALTPTNITPDLPVVTPVKVMASAQSAESRTTTKARRHGVHTLGDLINNVVSSIDKREDKLIEFTDTDDDQANITGINLGIIKVKKTKKVK